MASKRFRLGVGARALLIFVVAFGASAASIAGLNAQGAPPFTPAAPDDTTYDVTNIQVTHPYVSPDGSSTSDAAGVAYDMAWSGISFPGKADCLFRVFDAGGNELGSDVVEVLSLDPTVVGSAPFPIDIAGGVPVSATVECAEAIRAPGIYLLENLSLEPAPGDRVRLIADVAWSDDQLPTVGSCTAVFTSPGGAELSWAFSLQAPQGRLHISTLSSEFVESSPTGAECQPYEAGVG